MEAFTRLTATAVPFDRANIDTDQIIPARFLSRPIPELGKYAFFDLRYEGDGEDARSRAFALNDPAYFGGRILVAGENFGCGSSREHAVWALMNSPGGTRDYSFRCVIAPSFGDIFRANACKNGLLPVTLPLPVVEGLLAQLQGQQRLELTVDLELQCVITPDGSEHRFEFDSFEKECLLGGIEDIQITFGLESEVSAYERRRLNEKPWLAFAGINGHPS